MPPRSRGRFLAGGILIGVYAGIGATFGGAAWMRSHGREVRVLRAWLNGAQYLDERGVTRQAGAHDCAVACLTMMLADLPSAPPAGIVAARLGFLHRDASLYELTKAARMAGLEAESWVLSAADLVRARKPLIVFVDGNHFVVVDTADGRSVTVRDPALGRLRYAQAAFLAHWQGESLVVASAGSIFPVRSQPQGEVSRGIHRGGGGLASNLRPPAALSPLERNSIP